MQHEVTAPVLGYLRVSTADQADSGAGVAAQRAAINAEAHRRGWTVEFVTDAGFSARSMKRPGLAVALARLKAGDATTLVVAKMDRLSRSLLDFASIMQRAQRERWALVALDSPADLTTPSGEAMAGVMAVFAQLERRLISERTKAALAQRKAAGVRLGRERIIPSDVEARIHALRSEGLSIRRIGAALEREGHGAPGGGPWQPSTLHRVLTRAYVGGHRG
jgi:DNA invertase Pin-like site-specific DNA recombinase